MQLIVLKNGKMNINNIISILEIYKNNLMNLEMASVYLVKFKEIKHLLLIILFINLLGLRLTILEKVSI
jgi:hypothetical protein